MDYSNVWNLWWLGGTLNLGGRNEIQAARKLSVRCWIGTHDEGKKSGGFVAIVLKRRRRIEDVLEGSGGGKEDQIHHVALGSGETLELL